MSRLRRVRAPLVAGGAALAGCAVLALVDPNTPGRYPTCPTKLLTGLDCPFCGGLRCVRALVSGDLGAAADHNLLVVLLAPVAVVAWLAWLVSRWTDRPMPTVPLPPRLVLWSSVALVVAWSVLRNLPVGAYFGSGLA